MDLEKKLILEDLLDDTLEVKSEEAVEVPDLTVQEKSTFNFGTISEILTRSLDLYSFVTGVAADENLNTDVQTILTSVGEDLAVSIGKLQECLKLSGKEDTQDLISQGEEEVKELVTETPTTEE